MAFWKRGMAEEALKARALCQFRSELSSLLRRHDDALDSMPGWPTLCCMVGLYAVMSRDDVAALIQLDQHCHPLARAAMARLGAQGVDEPGDEAQ